MSLKVGILMGGPSEERDVSISTGGAVSKACIENGYLVTEFSFRNDYKKYLNEMDDHDIIFNALHGGIGENGSVQAWMDENGIKYTGSGSLASSLCMDKAKSKEIAKSKGIDTPKWQLLTNPDDEIEIECPFVVKPNDQGSTVGLTIVKNQRSIKSAIRKALKYGTDVIIEEYIDGKELTIPIIGNRPFPVVEINPAHDLYDYECKYTPGMSEYNCPAELDKILLNKIEYNTIILFEIFGCSIYARADYILDKSGIPYFLEMNTLPGMTSTSLVPKSANAKGLTFKQLIAKIIQLSL
jgi:D-alanine-D-alanine ligase